MNDQDRRQNQQRMGEDRTGARQPSWNVGQPGRDSEPEDVEGFQGQDRQDTGSPGQEAGADKSRNKRQRGQRSQGGQGNQGGQNRQGGRQQRSGKQQD